eukprot:2824587-Rhodomonas_salina.1
MGTWGTKLQSALENSKVQSGSLKQFSGQLRPNSSAFASGQTKGWEQLKTLWLEMGTWGIPNGNLGNTQKITGRFRDGCSLKQFSEQLQLKGSAFANAAARIGNDA